MAHRLPRPPITVSTHCGRVSLYRLPGRSVVVFTGEIDVAFRWRRFHRVVGAVGAAGNPLHVDCSGVTFFGAEGVVMMELLAGATVDRRFADVVTSPAVDRVARVLPVTGCTVVA